MCRKRQIPKNKEAQGEPNRILVLRKRAKYPGLVRRLAQLEERSPFELSDESYRRSVLRRHLGAGRVPRFNPPHPPHYLEMQRDTGERTRGTRTRTRVVLVRIACIIVRGMKHDGSPAIVREMHSCEVGHGTTRGRASYTPRRSGDIPSLSFRPFIFSAAHSRNTAQRCLSPSPRCPFFSFLSFALFSVHNTIRTVSLCYVWGSLKCAMIHISSPAAHSLFFSLVR